MKLLIAVLASIALSACATTPQAKSQNTRSQDFDDLEFHERMMRYDRQY